MSSPVCVTPDGGVEPLAEMPTRWSPAKLKWHSRIFSGTDQKDELGSFPLFGANGTIGACAHPSHREERVLIGRVGSAGAVNFASGSFGVSDNALVVDQDETLLGKFLHYAIGLLDFGPAISTTAQPLLTASLVKDFKVPVPPLEEQAAITAFLDRETAKIDTLVEQQQRLIELLKEKRQAAISHAVTKGLAPSPMKDSGVEWLGEVPAHWGVKRLRFLCDIETGDADTADAIEDGAYPFFVRSPTVERIDRYTHDCEAVLTAGDGAGVGKIYHHFSGKFCAHQRVYIFSRFRGVAGRFLYQYMMANFHKVALEGGAKSTVDSLRRPLIANFWITVPPTEEQSKIASMVDKMRRRFEDLTSEAEKAILLLRERRSALIAGAVAGAIDVRRVAHGGSMSEGAIGRVERVKAAMPSGYHSSEEQWDDLQAHQVAR